MIFVCRDPNLSHNESEYVLINDPQVKDFIWMPDLYLSNSRAAKFHEVMVPNFSMFIAQDGTIAYSGRITITVACNLNLVSKFYFTKFELFIFNI